MILETERLYLREMKKDDFNSLYKIYGDKDVMKYYPSPFNINMVKAWIDCNIMRYQTFGFGLWSVCLKENDEVIGDCGLTMQNINGLIKPEIGYHIRKDKQQRGYAKEAFIAVRDWTFTNTPFKEIYAYMKYNNVASYKTALAGGCHFVLEYDDEVNEKTCVYMISKDEWEKMINN